MYQWSLFVSDIFMVFSQCIFHFHSFKSIGWSLFKIYSNTSFTYLHTFNYPFLLPSLFKPARPSCISPRYLPTSKSPPLLITNPKAKGPALSNSSSRLVTKCKTCTRTNHRLNSRLLNPNAHTNSPKPTLNPRVPPKPRKENSVKSCWKNKKTPINSSGTGTSNKTNVTIGFLKFISATLWTDQCAEWIVSLPSWPNS